MQRMNRKSLKRKYFFFFFDRVYNREYVNKHNTENSHSKLQKAQKQKSTQKQYKKFTIKLHRERERIDKYRIENRVTESLKNKKTNKQI